MKYIKYIKYIKSVTGAVWVLWSRHASPRRPPGRVPAVLSSRLLVSDPGGGHRPRRTSARRPAPVWKVWTWGEPPRQTCKYICKKKKKNLMQTRGYLTFFENFELNFFSSKYKYSLCYSPFQFFIVWLLVIITRFIQYWSIQ